MGIRSLAKQIHSSFDKSLHCHEMLVRGCKSLEYFVLGPVYMEWGTPV